jgi:hypothetical protein
LGEYWTSCPIWTIAAWTKFISFLSFAWSAIHVSYFSSNDASRCLETSEWEEPVVVRHLLSSKRMKIW